MVVYAFQSGFTHTQPIVTFYITSIIADPLNAGSSPPQSIPEFPLKKSVGKHFDIFLFFVTFKPRSCFKAKNDFYRNRD
jgi:hypothetical protein